MTSPDYINETYVSDGKGGQVLVKPEDQVDLIPNRHYDSLCRFLGRPGPYTIYSIGRWPCGRVMLYLKLENDRVPGAYASDFMRVEVAKKQREKEKIKT